MWIKKSQQELTNEQRVQLFGMGLRAMCIALLLFGFGLPHNSFQIPVGIRIAVVVIIGVVLLAGYRRALRRRRREPILICERCNLVKEEMEQSTCACGGKLTPFAKMKWLEMPPIQEIPDPDVGTPGMLGVVQAV